MNTKDLLKQKRIIKTRFRPLLFLESDKNTNSAIKIELQWKNLRSNHKHIFLWFLLCP